MERDVTRTVTVSPWAASRPLQIRRDARPDEIALLRSLAAGAAAVKSGPIGRCTKRGWCRAILPATDQGCKRSGPVLFELTAAGLGIILDAPL